MGVRPDKPSMSLSDFLQVPGEAGVRWTPLFTIPPYIAVIMMGIWSHKTVNGVRLGAVMNGFDVRAISRELGRLKLGKGGPTSKGRLYTSVNGDWMYDMSGVPVLQPAVRSDRSFARRVCVSCCLRPPQPHQNFCFILQSSSKK